MKKALVIAAALSVPASVAFAGGPVVVPADDDVTVVTAPAPSSSGSFLPLVLGAIVIGAVVAGSGS